MSGQAETELTSKQLSSTGPLGEGVYELARNFIPEPIMVSDPAELQLYPGFLQRVWSGKAVEPGDRDVPIAVFKNFNRMVVQHAYSELVGTLPEGEFLSRAPNLERERDLIAKTTDEVGHSLYYLDAYQGSRTNALGALARGKIRYSVVFDDSPTQRGGWAGNAGIQICVDGGAVINQNSLIKTSWGPYSRANRRVTSEEGAHTALGEESAYILANGTDRQRAMITEALSFWWSRGLMVNGPKDTSGPWSLFSLQTGLKTITNDDAHHGYVKTYYHILETLGVSIQNPLEINEKEFKALINVGGPFHDDRIEARKRAFVDGGWVRDALAASAKEQEPPIYDVFHQESEKKPFASVGSILGTNKLAPLLAARLFGRRPRAAKTRRLSVVRRDRILKLTPYTNQETLKVPEGPPGQYAVFIKRGPNNTAHFVEFSEEVKANSHQQALDLILAGEEKQPTSFSAIWIVNTNDIISLLPEQIEIMFSPAHHRQFLDPPHRGHFNRKGEFHPPDYSPYPVVSKENAVPLEPEIRTALRDFLLALADDSLMLAQRLSEWIGHSPLPESDLDIGYHALHSHTHAMAYYELRYLVGGQKDEDDPDTVVYFRNVSEFKSAQITELENTDWGHTVIRIYLMKTAEVVRLERLRQSAYPPLADTSNNLLNEARSDLLTAVTWMKVLATATDEARDRLQQALTTLWPYALQLFVPVNNQTSYHKLVSRGFIPSSAEVHDEWNRQVRDSLTKVGLYPPDPESPKDSPVTDDRDQHTSFLAQMVEKRQALARTEEPGTKW